MRSMQKHREPLLLVVVARVIAERALERVQVAVDRLARHALARCDSCAPARAGGMWPFEHDLCAGRYLKWPFGLADARIDQLGRGSTQQAGELILRQRVGDRRDRAQHGRRISPQRHRHRKRTPRVEPCELAKVLCAAAMGQPTHDGGSAPDHLLAVDAQVLPLPRIGPGLGSARDDQAPGDQRTDIAWPAGLDRPARQVDRIGLDALLAAWPARAHGGLHVPECLGHFHQPACVGKTAGRFRLAKACQQRTEMAQISHSTGTHPEGHPLGRTKQIDEHFCLETGGLGEQQSRPLSAQRDVGNCRHFEIRRDRFFDPEQFAGPIQACQEVAKVSVSACFCYLEPDLNN